MATITWIGQSGNWNDATNWDSGTVPGAGDDVSIAGFNYYSVSSSTAIQAASITIGEFLATLDLSGDVKDVVSGDLLNQGSFDVDRDFGAGGTSVDIGGTFANQYVTTIGNTFSTGRTTVEVGHLINGGVLYLEGGASADTRSALIDTGDVAPTTITGTFNLMGDALLEFASGSITSIAIGGALNIEGAHARVADADHPNSNSALKDLSSNAGSFTLGGGSSLFGLENAFQNDGRFSVYGGSKFTTADGVDFTNTAIVDVDYFQTGGSTFRIGGTLTNIGIMQFGPASAVSVAHLVNSGEIDLSGGQVGIPQSEATIFDDRNDAAPTTLLSGVTLDIAGDAVLLFGSGSITSVAQGASLTLDGSRARIADVGASGVNSALSGFISNAGTVVIADGAILHTGAAPFDNSGTYSIITNSGSNYTPTSVSFSAGFINSGTLNVDSNGLPYGQYSRSALTIGGALTNSGTINIGSGPCYPSSNATIVTVHNFAEMGTINISGYTQTQNVLAELKDTTDLAPSTLQSGTAINLSGDALLQFAGGAITSIGAGAQLSIDGVEARVANSAAPTFNSALTTLSSNAGTLILSDGADLRNSGVAFTNSGTFAISQNTVVTTDAGVDFTNSGVINLDVPQLTFAGGSTLAVGGTLFNSGTINVGVDIPSSTTEIIANHFVNTGTINLDSPLNSTSLAWLNDSADAAPTTLAAGVSLNLTGDALLEYGQGKIKTISAGAQISVDGAQAFIADAAHTNSNSALTQLASNAGTLILADGAVISGSQTNFSNSGTFSLLHQENFHVTQDFQNSGTFNVDFGTNASGEEGQSQVAVDGTLTNAGTLNVGDTHVALDGNTSVTVAHLVNTGAININSFPGNTYQATVDVLDDTVASTIVSGVSINLSGDTLLEYAGGGITSVASGGQLSLNGANARIADASDTSTNSALTGLVNNAGVMTFAGGVSLANGGRHFTNSGTLTVETGSLFKIGAALINTGTIDVTNNGGGALTAVSLTNSGTIDVVGSQTGISISANATNSGTVEIGASGSFFGGSLTVSGNYTQSRGETDLQNGGNLSAKQVILTGGILQGSGGHLSNIDVQGGTYAAGMFTQSQVGFMFVNGNLAVDAGGTFGATLIGQTGQQSEIQISGTVTLGGTLDLNIPDPANLHAGETFTIMTFNGGKLSGQFSEIRDGSFTGNGTSVDIGNGLTLDVLYHNNTGSVQVQVVATPAPAAHELMADNAQHGLLTNDAVLALDTHGLSWHHGDHAFLFEHALGYDNAPLI